MATIRASLPHEQRTAGDPREANIEPVFISHIHDVTDRTRLLRLSPIDPKRTIRFLPGQWLDTFIPGLPHAGGFTITSTPAQARPSASSPAFLELAVQQSSNPPAQWLRRPEDEILGSQLVVRVGGKFVWPPPARTEVAERLVLVAGGVGINPLISIFAHLIRSSTRPRQIRFLYATKCEGGELDRQRILFLPRLMDLVAAADDHSNIALGLFLTGLSNDGEVIEHGQFPNQTFARRIQESDLLNAIGENASGENAEAIRERTTCYVCGPPKMTDEFVDILRKQPGMSVDRVLCENWW